MPETAFIQTSSVVQRILDQGRKAMLGGTPILYIKTDSDFLIERIVADRKHPLVVLRGIYGKQEDRPLMEADNETFIRSIREQRESSTGDYCHIHFDDYHDELDEAKDLQYPRIWTIKMPGDIQSDQYQQDLKLGNMFNALEKYVLEYHNENRLGRNHEHADAIRSSVVVLYSSEVNLTPMLKTYTEIIEVGYPDEYDIRSQICTETGNPLGLARILDELVTSLTGFTEEEISICLQRIMTLTGLGDDAWISDEQKKEILNIILERKKQKLEGGLLEWIDTEGELGGMGSYYEWLADIKEPLSNSAAYRRNLGVQPPKGVLLCGIPGCGKSEAAKLTGREIELPLLKMSMGKIMGGIVGQSERQMRETLKLAEAMSPCVLLIDEIEKAMEGAKGGGEQANDSTFRRMFAELLEWMQNNHKPVFIFAAANDIGGLPKEFFRPGRIDEKFATYLPNEDECVDIFLKCMDRVERIAGKNSGMTGRKILFDHTCRDRAVLREIVQGMANHQNVRIMIGSDIEAIVQKAQCLRMPDETDSIDIDSWKKKLEIACQMVHVYGDSEENIDSIADNYIRLLRKGFLSTAEKPLFDPKQYHSNYFLKYRNKSKICMLDKADADSLRALGPYDSAVYDCLYERINDRAPIVEEIELKRGL
ncbi:MAG: AAA family ATPase [Clostridiales bacterium]|nr:AAA family ATPase [Clostridiales bacterium]